MRAADTWWELAVALNAFWAARRPPTALRDDGDAGLAAWIERQLDAVDILRDHKAHKLLGPEERTVEALLRLVGDPVDPDAVDAVAHVLHERTGASWHRGHASAVSDRLDADGAIALEEGEAYPSCDPPWLGVLDKPLSARPTALGHGPLVPSRATKAASTKNAAAKSHAGAACRTAKQGVPRPATA